MQLRNLASVNTCSVLISRRINHFKNLLVAIDIARIPSILAVVGVAALSWNGVEYIHYSEVSFRRNSDWILKLHWPYFILQHSRCNGCCCLSYDLFIFFEDLISDLKIISVIMLKHAKPHDNESFLTLEHNSIPRARHIPVAGWNISKPLEYFRSAWIQSSHYGI